MVTDAPLLTVCLLLTGTAWPSPLLPLHAAPSPAVLPTRTPALAAGTSGGLTRG